MAPLVRWPPAGACGRMGPPIKSEGDGREDHARASTPPTREPPHCPLARRMLEPQGSASGGHPVARPITREL